MEDIIDHLKPFATVRQVKTGSNIIFQGEIPRRAYIIRQGLIRAYTLTSTGEERIVGIYGKGDMFPITWLLGETTNALFYYDAIADTTILGFQKSDFNNHIANNTDLIPHLLKYLGSQYTSSMIRINGLEQPRAIEKLGYIVYFLLFRYGIETEPGIYTIRLTLTHITIANLIGITRESTTLNLRKLKAKGILDYSRTNFTVDKAKLEGFIGEDSFRDVILER